MGRMIDQAVLSEYLSESEQLLDSLLVDLERLAVLAGAGGAQEPTTSLPELINRIFRNVHSIKGLSGMMGMEGVKSQAHEFENVLDDLRLGKLRLDERVAGLLRESGEWLATLIVAAARGSVIEEDSEALRNLLHVLAQLPRASRKRSGGIDSLKLSARDRDLLTPYEEHRIITNVEAGRSIYEIDVEVRVDDLESSFRSLTDRMGARGELISSLPAPVTRGDAIGLKLLFATGSKEGEVESLARPFGARVERIGPSFRRRAEAAIKRTGRRKKSGHGKASRAGTSEPAPAPPGDQTGPASVEAARKESAELAEIPLSRAMGLASVAQATAQEFLQPLSQGVRIDLGQIDEISSLAHELNIEAQRLTAMAGRVMGQPELGAKDRFDLKQSSRRLERHFLELEERLVELRMVSLSQTFNRAARLAERLARELNKKVSVEVTGGSTELDKMIVDRLSGPIYHILRNALDHGMEPPEERLRSHKPATGKIKLDSRLEGTEAVITISDDGRGIDHNAVLKRALEIGAISAGEELTKEQVLRFILRPGFSTAVEVSEVSGRGVGLDAVERAIYELAGEVRIYSEPGRGTRFELSVPTTLVMISAFIVAVADYRYAINVGNIIELIYLSPGDITGPDGKRRVTWRGSGIPLIELRYLLGLGGARRLGPAIRPKDEPLSVAGPPNSWAVDNRDRGLGAGPGDADQRIPALITRVAERNVAIAVERFDRQRDIIVKSLGGLGRKLKGVVGAVDLEGGDVALVLDLASLLMLRSVRV